MRDFAVMMDFSYRFMNITFQVGKFTVSLWQGFLFCITGVLLLRFVFKLTR